APVLRAARVSGVPDDLTAAQIRVVDDRQLLADLLELLLHRLPSGPRRQLGRGGVLGGERLELLTKQLPAPDEGLAVALPHAREARVPQVQVGVGDGRRPRRRLPGSPRRHGELQHPGVGRYGGARALAELPGWGIPAA